MVQYTHALKVEAIGSSETLATIYELCGPYERI
jgi:hypothetical protein